MTNLPPGVEAFDASTSRDQASRNFIALVYGGPKTGKTHFWNQAERPLYVVYLDTNPNLETHLLKSTTEWGDEVYKLVLRPLSYEDLTEAEVNSRLDKIHQFAEWAKERAEERAAEGKPGGTFVVDGTTYLKGYYEKALLGESATLGYRPKAGERSGISTYDYAKSNAALFDFIAGFTGTKLDAVFTFEGRPVYKDVIGGDGRSKTVKTDSWKSTRPDRVPYAVNVEVETLKVLERIDPSNNQSPLRSALKLRVLFNSENPALDQFVFDGEGMGFQKLKQMLLSESVGEIELARAKHVSEVVRANTSGLLINEGEED